ncbi:MAG TPA: hypothetical protein VMY42_13275 [Thermoguttaceae bacterium]|nr:hypothetical protein [Thermoguttaceae bacterium]
MIPNAVASTGPYAGLWSHLKSINHALERALAAGSSKELAELDIDRLRALSEFLDGGLSSAPGASGLSTSLVEYSNLTEPDYNAAIDLRSRLAYVPEFDNWLKSSKKGFDTKLQRLIASISNFLSPSGDLLARETPHQEFEILRAIVQSLLSEAETALH